MKYQTGRAGRIIVAKFEDGEDILANLGELALREGIKAAVFYVVGGMRKGRIVVGPERDELPPEPIWREFRKSHEVFGIGTIFWERKTPKIHFHGTFGRKSTSKTGCLREKAETFLVLEAVIVEIKGIKAARELDPVSGLTLLKL